MQQKFMSIAVDWIIKGINFKTYLTLISRDSPLNNYRDTSIGISIRSRTSSAKHSGSHLALIRTLMIIVLSDTDCLVEKNERSLKAGQQNSKVVLI